MKYFVIDAREPAEYASGYIEGAVNIPAQQLLNSSNMLDYLPKDTNIIVYCRAGNRSAVAKNILGQQGFRNVINGINKEQVHAHYDLPIILPT